MSNETAFGRVKNNLKCGIVGLPNVGKSSLFNLLCEQSIPAENYPFCTIEPNEARSQVHDDRYEYLCSIWKPLSMQPAYLQITDIAGLIRGASEGAGLGSNFLSHIQAVDGLFHVIRVFEDSDIVHVDDAVDPIRDLETINIELCLKDLEFAKKAIAVEEQAVKKTGGRMKLSPNFLNATAKIVALLEQSKPVRMGSFTSGEIELINEKMNLITTKPMIYLVNMSANDIIRKKNKWLPKINSWIKANGGGALMPFSIEHEQEMWAQRGDKEALAALVMKAPSQLPKIVLQGYKDLNLMFYFTAGIKEVRCWTVYAGSEAPVAASVIHTDFLKLFIKAEVVSYADFKEFGDGTKSMASVKTAGKYRSEGKSYIVKDGDIIHFAIGTSGKK